ncbi:MAG: hypothetical protein HXY34_13870 [Candidatus Thorarchaeota archaeon]|nr:hypothetical protein [Candidatus Thorarchaeota archaeon]
MSHREGQSPRDAYDLDPKEVLAQYTVEWVSLRRSYEEVKQKLKDMQDELNALDAMLRSGRITEQEHVDRYHEIWHASTEMIQVKREVEGRLSEIQREIRQANREVKTRDEERLRKERAEQERANAMIEWMSLKQGFELIRERRQEISSMMDRLEMQRRSGELSESEYRKRLVEHVRNLAELRTVEDDVKRRLSELLQIIRG